MIPSIYFYSEDTDFILQSPEKIKAWLLSILSQHEVDADNINYIFCSDRYLHQMNVSYLNHDTLTDIITFPLHMEGDPIISDIYISIDRVRENAESYNVSIDEELIRVIGHGLYHLLGYKDKLPADQKIMRAKEEEGIKLFYTNSK